MTPRWILVRLFSAPSRFCGYVNEHWPERRSSPVCLLNLYIFKQMTSSLGACVGSWTPELLFCCSSDVERSGASVSILCLLTSGLNRSLLTVSPLLPPVCFPGAPEATPSQVAFSPVLRDSPFQVFRQDVWLTLYGSVHSFSYDCRVPSTRCKPFKNKD